MKRKKETELDPCPFCGGPAHFIICDDEGNVHGEEYEDDPWSGLAFMIGHEEADGRECPIASNDGWNPGVGMYSYPTRKAAAKAWNKRARNE